MEVGISQRDWIQEKREREKNLRWKYGLPIAKQWKQQSAAAALLDLLEAIQSKQRKRVGRAIDMFAGLPETEYQPLQLT